MKSPKLYFYDVGLASYLLGIKNKNHIDSHPLKGSLFENMVIMETIKNKLNSVENLSRYYFRDNVGNEVDLLDDQGTSVITYEIKLSQTITTDVFKGLKFYKKLNPDNKKSFLVYTGKDKVTRYGHKCLPFTEL